MAIFDAQAITINTYDHAGAQMVYHYAYERGRNFGITTRPLNSFDVFFLGIEEYWLRDENLRETVSKDFPDVVPIQGDLPKSYLCVPLRREGSVSGYISLQNLDREHAFSQGDIRLLITLANSMSVALENARLFDETQRLLKETEQRAEELATVNAVVTALAGELDLNALNKIFG